MFELVLDDAKWWHVKQIKRRGHRPGSLRVRAVFRTMRAWSLDRDWWDSACGVA